MYVLKITKNGGRGCMHETIWIFEQMLTPHFCPKVVYKKEGGGGVLLGAYGLAKNCMQWVEMSKSCYCFLVNKSLLLIAVLGWPAGCVSWPAVFLCGWSQGHLWPWLLSAVQHRTGTKISLCPFSHPLFILFFYHLLNSWTCICILSSDALIIGSVTKYKLPGQYLQITLSNYYICIFDYGKVTKCYNVHCMEYRPPS